MKGTGVFLTLLLGCLLYQAPANGEQSAVETRRLVHSPVADYYPGGGYGGGGFGNKGYGGGFGGYGNNFYGGGGYGGYGGYGYGPRPYGGYGGYGFGPRCYGGYGGYGFGPGGYGGYGPRGYGGYGGYGYGPRGCRYGYPRRNGQVFVNVNLHRLRTFLPGFHPMGKIPFFNQYFTEGFPGFGGGFHASPFLPGFPSMGKIPFFNNHFLGGYPVFGGGAYASPFLGKIPFFNRYFNYFPSTHHGYFQGGSFPFFGKSSFGFQNDFSHFGGGPYSGGYGKGYGYH